VRQPDRFVPLPLHKSARYASVMQNEELMTHKARLHELFDAMAKELLSFIKESENEFPDGWVPATFIKDQLELKKSAYPPGNKIDQETGWLFATLASVPSG
jgi:hypothetical protein